MTLIKWNKWRSENFVLVNEKSDDYVKKKTSSRNGRLYMKRKVDSSKDK